jgi:hypothetical protein
VRGQLLSGQGDPAEQSFLEPPLAEFLGQHAGDGVPELLAGLGVDALIAEDDAMAARIFSGSKILISLLL